MLRKILRFFGLALEKDYTYTDCMWVCTLNHISLYLCNPKTPLTVVKNLIELAMYVDESGKELLNDFMIDWKNKDNNTEDYNKVLDRICPIILKYNVKYRSESK